MGSEQFAWPGDCLGPGDLWIFKDGIFKDGGGKFETNVLNVFVAITRE